MTNRRRDGQSSLDLLLDTICNTFGGVLFISMLMVILLNLTSEAVVITTPEAPSQAELVQLEQQLRARQSELETLRTAMRQQEQIERQLADPNSRELLRSLKSSRERRELLADLHVQAVGEIGRAQIEINQTARALEEMDAALARARKSLESAEQSLQEEVARRSRTAQLPKLRETAKLEVPFFLRGGKLCAYARQRADGKLVPNEAEFEEKQDADGKPYVEPKPAAGMPVDPRAGGDQPLVEKFKQFDPAQHFLTVFVWPDSFAHFRRVKDAMVAGGFEYRLVPFPEDAKVYLGQTSDRALVQ